jgi:hypothetical protein
MITRSRLNPSEIQHAISHKFSLFISKLKVTLIVFHRFNVQVTFPLIICWNWLEKVLHRGANWMKLVTYSEMTILQIVNPISIKPGFDFTGVPLVVIVNT